MQNFSAAFFRRLAWEQLESQWGSVLLFTLVYSLCYDVVYSACATAGVGLLASFVLAPMVYAYQVAFLNNRRDGVEFKIDSLFSGYNQFTRLATTGLLVCLYTLLWSLLFIIPGIIKSISYSQTMFILKDNPNMENNEAIELSMEMMEGYKMNYFMLQLSFIGWWLLVFATCGIALLWVKPYLTAAEAHFYEYVKWEHERRLMSRTV